MLTNGGKIDSSLSDDALKKQLAENDKAMRDMKLSYEEKLAEATRSQVRFYLKACHVFGRQNKHLNFILINRVVRIE